MKLLSIAGGLLSLLLSCGVAEAKEDCPEYIQNGVKMVSCFTLPKPVKQICGSQGECVDANKGKHVVIEYNDFLKMVAMKEHSDNTRDKLAAENAVLVKLKDEQSTVIQLQKEDIQACREIVKSHEQLGETESQISKAVEAELRARIAELERREKWAVGSGIGIGAGTVAIIWAVMWALN